MKETFESLYKIIRAVVFIALIYFYIKEWLGALKEGKILKFILLSIIPAITVYYMYFEIVYGCPPPGMDNPYMSYDDFKSR
jgi:hypothetical protein